ncbi:PIN domain-containing protein [Cupriavidus taiwanensis]|uniref:type II toxin-antitoxin system VapC family toxin n=1 Tax=Cupriavidus taiwanensis TaxID=164546 RepID=UPI000E116A8D|nr:PIN domain-containing protein [Cupriavidus taiwanensis]SOZ31716.1 putative toxin of a toxin/antitoxin system, PIN domain [Cupriavidus taiwanensis]SPA36465.1 putative toxin of a toxin/antitoxin system, PIN domain [Cupriavidus taiwanensis]SPA53114.1 putative toxin of a toxin/antitoxin system, PIN domain [Cupriavidus taiwanensis]
MNVLVDTSVWVGHFRQRNDALIRLMEADQVLTHPLVVTELACGTPPSPRAQTLGDIGLLQAARQATLGEVIALVEREQLYGLGCGLVDVTLLASTLITPGARLWTLDQRLSALSVRFGVGYRPRLH